MKRLNIKNADIDIMRKELEMAIEGQYSYDGAGVKLRRIFGGQNAARYTDPFLPITVVSLLSMSKLIPLSAWLPSL